MHKKIDRNTQKIGTSRDWRFKTPHGWLKKCIHVLFWQFYQHIFNLSSCQRIDTIVPTTAEQEAKFEEKHKQEFRVHTEK